MLTYLSLILSAMSSVLAVLPFVYLWRIIREVLQVQPDFSQATGIVRNGWMAVLFAVLAWLVYVGALVCSHGSASALPVSSDSFDLATAFETVYFWPEIETCFTEVRRVLKEGGTFMICNESDGTDETSLKFEKIIDGMKCYTPQQLAAALRTAGFSEVNAVHHPKKPWITVIARK